MRFIDQWLQSSIKEKYRLLVLFLLIFSVYYPFLWGTNLGSSDAHRYHSMLASAIDQFNHGIFPVYIAQGVFDFFGSPLIRAPYYLLLGQFLQLVTFGLFDTIYIQHFTVFFTAMAAGFITYFILKKLSTERQYNIAIFFAFFYVSCPAILGSMYFLCMYYSFMTLPFLPILFYGLIRSYELNDFFSDLLIAGSLSLYFGWHILL